MDEVDLLSHREAIIKRGAALKNERKPAFLQARGTASNPGPEPKPKPTPKSKLKPKPEPKPSPNPYPMLTSSPPSYRTIVMGPHRRSSRPPLRGAGLASGCCARRVRGRMRCRTNLERLKWHIDVMIRSRCVL